MCAVVGLRTVSTSSTSCRRDVFLELSPNKPSSGGAYHALTQEGAWQLDGIASPAPQNRGFWGCSSNLHNWLEKKGLGRAFLGPQGPVAGPGPYPADPGRADLRADRARARPAGAVTQRSHARTDSKFYTTLYCQLPRGTAFTCMQSNRALGRR